MGAGASVDEGVTVDGELAKVLSASDNDLAKAADKLNRDIKRMVPKTASGRLDAASIKEDERESVLEVLGRARRLAEHGYAVFALARFCRDGDMRWWLERGRESDVLHSPHAGKAHTKH